MENIQRGSEGDSSPYLRDYVPATSALLTTAVSL